LLNKKAIIATDELSGFHVYQPKIHSISIEKD